MSGGGWSGPAGLGMGRAPLGGDGHSPLPPRATQTGRGTEGGQDALAATSGIIKVPFSCLRTEGFVEVSEL